MKRRNQERQVRAKVARRISSAVSVVAILGALFVADIASPALATNRPASPAATVRVVKGTMTVQCKVTNRSLVTHAILANPASVKALCARAGIPGSGPAARAAGHITPNNTVFGACGLSEFYIYSTGTSGRARIYEVADPFYYAIDYGAADMTWENLSKGGHQTWTDFVWANSYKWYWQNNDYKTTKTGRVTGWMTGDVLLLNGEVCSIALPSDTQTVH